MLHRIFHSILFSLLLNGCAASHRNAHSPQLSEKEVVAIANQAAQDSGADLSQFLTPEAHFEYVAKDFTWAVFYRGVEPAIGNHFLVVVNDRTGAAQLSGGL
ncbi:hypothetical protein [Dokdonella sp.]|uniref:hypothetical protein n=1 Tax=Dokdonella sp. TaxID=2291710 RepID=UPI0035286042